MAPIISPKLLSQILMHGRAVITSPLSAPKPVPLLSLPVKSVSRLAVAVETKKTITDAPASTLALLPNYTFIRKHVDQDVEDELVSPLSSSGSELEIKIGTFSSTSSTVCSISASLSQPSSARSSIDSPSTPSASTLPQEKLTHPLPTARVPRYKRSRPLPIDSLRIARQRRASEPPEGSLFISRPRQKDSSGFKKFSRKLLKKVIW